MSFDNQPQPGKKLSTHIKHTHSMKAEEYTVKFLCGNSKPMCPVCGDPTRYVAYSFKKYCAKHSREAEVAGGRQGGKAQAWSKGLTKKTDARLAAQALKVSGTLNPFYGKRHKHETLEAMAVSKRLNETELIKRTSHRSDFEMVTSPEEYTSRQLQYLIFRCKKCATECKKTLQAFERGSLCDVCYPQASIPQLEIAEFIKSIYSGNVVICDRTVIGPMELDIWLPELRIAIEYHGLFWHSGGLNDQYDRRRHRQKYVMCRDKGIKLIQLFSDEWRDHRSASESIIRHAIGRDQYRLNARDCSTVTINPEQSRQFLTMNHMAGYVQAKHHIALIHPAHGIVAVASSRRPIQKKWGDNVIELARMAFAPGIRVRGGVSKLIAGLRRLLPEASGMLSYAELRYGEGQCYQACGFIRMPDVENNYWYTDGISRYDRFKYRAQSPLTEKQVAEAANVRPVYGCGNAVYVQKWQ
jgi:hypothetical protein